MSFPAYVHSVVGDSSEAAWPMCGQGWNECSFTSIANALNLLAGAPRHTKDEFAREVGPLFQPRLGGTLPPLKAIQLRRRGYGAHFGSLGRTDAERVLRGLVDRGVPTIVDIYTSFQLGTTRVYGMHATLLVGYSEPYRDAAGALREEYYLVDPGWPEVGRFDMASNNVDRDGDGVPEVFPGNRTLERAELLRLWTTRNYCPVFRTREAHAAWYAATLRREPGPPLVGTLAQGLLFGSDDRLR
ncbi:MAG: hypothetical protein RLZZ387_207 [Chloroflexota bacterium]|jgi:hypothetical protein